MINYNMISNFPFDCGRLINLDQFRGVSSASEADDEKRSDGREYCSLDLVVERVKLNENKKRNSQDVKMRGWILRDDTKNICHLFLG